MKKGIKWVIGTLTATALASGLFLYDRQKDNFKNPQEVLNQAFNTHNPKNISEIIYDPEGKRAETYVRSSIGKMISQADLEVYLTNLKEQSKDHLMNVIGISTYVGNGEKRPVFAKRELNSSTSSKSVEDLISAIAHEDAHAEDNRTGYRFGNRTVKGYELTNLLHRGEIRGEVLVGIGELDAYATQLEQIDKMEKKPSRINISAAKANLYKIWTIVEKGLQNGQLAPLEKLYAETVINEHKKTIETLKKTK